MSEPQSDLQETSQTTFVPSASASAPASRSNEIRTVIIICSLGVIGCFFLPWVQIFLGSPSGYQLQQLPSDELKLLWLIPGTAAVALLSALANKSIAVTGRIAGLMPFLTLFYYGSKIGQGIFQALQGGAYLTLICALVLFAAPFALKKPTS